MLTTQTGRTLGGVRDESRRGAQLDTIDESRYILVVDDDDSICDLIAEVLREEGYEVTATRDAARALQLIEQRPPALILLDLSIADQSAESIVTAVRELPGQTTSVIVVSGHTNVGQRAEQVGADGYLPKPFDIPILVDTVQAVLSVRRGGS
jgi:DNA-binding response OmpR family regulator